MNLPPTYDIYMSILPPNIGHCCVVAKSCLTRDCMDCHPAFFSVNGIFQARILEWVAIPTPEDLPNLGIKSTYLGTPALADRLLLQLTNQY